MKNLQWFLTLVIFMIYNIALAQTINDQNIADLNYIQPSPTAAELGRYGDCPVDYFHGMAQINVPIYTLNVGMINLPIDLSYYGSGIKVDQEASWVGLGWSLNAGGVITHKVNDISDFEEEFEVPSFDAMQDTSWKYNPPNTSASGAAFFDKITSVDCQPDIYSYNFCGYSGRFVFERPYNGNIVFLNNTDGLKLLDMEKTYEVISFSFVDKKGITYEFNEYEESHYAYAPFDIKDDEYFVSPCNSSYYEDSDIDGSDCISAFYLTKITSPDGHTVEFEYTDINTFVISGYSGSLYYFLSSDSWRGSLTSSLGTGRINGCYVESKVLSEISTNTGITIELDATTSREDIISSFSGAYSANIANGCRLDNIYLKYDDTRVKRWNFKYDYFGSSLTVNSVTESTSNSEELEKRLKLLSLTEFGKTDSDSTYYSFSYYDDDEMPFRFCFTGKDKYGYCNSSSITTREAQNSYNLFHNQTGTIPSSDDYIEDVIDAIYYSYCGSATGPCTDAELCMMNFYNDGSSSYDFENGRDSDPNLDCAKINSLKKIIYPTGGYSEFDYGLNKYYLVCNENETAYKYFNIEDDTPNKTLAIEYGGGLRIKEINNNDDTQDVTKTFTYAQWGVLTYEPIWAVQTKPYNNYYSTLDDGYLCTIETLNITPMSGSNVMYAKVIEESTPGKTVYRYNSPIEYPSEFKVHHYGFTDVGSVTYPAYFFKNPYNSSAFTASYAHFSHGPYCISAPVGIFSEGWKNPEYIWGKLKSKKVFNEDDDILQLTEYYYNIIENESVYGLKSHYHSVASSGDKSSHNRFGIYEIINAKVFPKQKEITNFFYDAYGTQNSVETTETYEYDTDNELLMSDVTTNSIQKIKTVYTYPPNISNASTSSVLYSMCNDNMLDYIVEKISYMDNEVTSSIYNSYQTKYGNIVPYQIYSLEITTPIDSSDFDLYDGSTKNSNYSSTAEATYINYDSQGNPLKTYTKDGSYTYYLWAYNNQYPVAKIVSTQNTTISITVSDNSLSNGSALSGIKSDVEYMEGLLGNYINDGDYMVSLYTYKPLVGITSETAPNGTSIYYSYDSFGRLAYVYNDNDVKLKRYTYNYANN